MGYEHEQFPVWDMNMNISRDGLCIRTFSCDGLWIWTFSCDGIWIEYFPV